MSKGGEVKRKKWPPWMTSSPAWAQSLALSLSRGEESELRKGWKESARSWVKIKSSSQRHLLEMTLDGARFNTTTTTGFVFTPLEELCSWKQQQQQQPTSLCLNSRFGSSRVRQNKLGRLKRVHLPEGWFCLAKTKRASWNKDTFGTLFSLNFTSTKGVKFPPYFCRHLFIELCARSSSLVSPLFLPLSLERMIR